MSGGRSLRFALSGGLEPDKLADLREAVADLMRESEVPMEQRHALAVVFEELCTNVMEHSGAQWIELGVVTGGGVACLSLSDNGSPFDPSPILRTHDFSARLEEVQDRHLGLFMLQKLTEGFHYLREEDGVNRVTLQLSKSAQA